MHLCADCSRSMPLRILDLYSMVSTFRFLSWLWRSSLVFLPAHVICINRQSSLVRCIPADPATESKQKRRRRVKLAVVALPQELHLCEEARWMQSCHAPSAAPDDDVNGIADESKRASSDFKVRLRQPLPVAVPICAIFQHDTWPIYEVAVQGLHVHHTGV